MNPNSNSYLKSAHVTSSEVKQKQSGADMAVAGIVHVHRNISTMSD